MVTFPTVCKACPTLDLWPICNRSATQPEGGGSYCHLKKCASTVRQWIHAKVRLSILILVQPFSAGDYLDWDAARLDCPDTEFGLDLLILYSLPVKKILCSG
jgi:hypothetical protein